MDYELGYAIASLALFSASLFFWGRGIIRGRKDDIVAGVTIFVLVCVLSFAGAMTSVVFGQVGVLVMLFGVLTLIASSFAAPECPLPRSQRIRLGVWAIILGLLMTMIL